MAEDKPASRAKEPPPPPVLGVAGESSDPRVQHLLAEREIAVRNGDDAAVAEFTNRLAGLGVA